MQAPVPALAGLSRAPECLERREASSSSSRPRSPRRSRRRSPVLRSPPRSSSPPPRARDGGEKAPGRVKVPHGVPRPGCKGLRAVDIVVIDFAVFDFFVGGVGGVVVGVASAAAATAAGPSLPPPPPPPGELCSQPGVPLVGPAPELVLSDAVAQQEGGVRGLGVFFGLFGFVVVAAAAARGGCRRRQRRQGAAPPIARPSA